MPHKITLENGAVVEICDRDYEALAKAVQKTSRNWRAKKGETFYFVNHFGNISDTKEYFYTEDDYKYNTLNYFPTEAEAEEYKKYLLALGKVTRAIRERNGEFSGNIHYQINKNGGIYVPGMWLHTSIFPEIYSQAIAEQIHKDFKEEIAFVFDYKERNMM